MTRREKHKGATQGMMSGDDTENEEQRDAEIQGGARWACCRSDVGVD